MKNKKSSVLITSNKKDSTFMKQESFKGIKKGVLKYENFIRSISHLDSIL